MIFSLFRKKEKEPTKISLDDLPDFIEKEFSRQIRDAKNSVSNQVNDIKSGIDKLEKEFLSFKDLAAKDNFSASIKNNFCDRSINALRSIHYPDNSFPIKTFFSGMSDIMKKVGGVSVKEIRHLYEFEKSMKEITSQVKSIEAKIRIAEKTMVRFREVEGVEKIRNITDEIKHMKEKKHSLQQSIRKNEDEHASLSVDAGRKQREFQEFLNNFREHDRLQSRRKQLEDDISSIRMKIANELSGIERPLKKFQHIDIESRHKLLDDYIRNPAEAFISDDQNTLMAIMGSVKEAARRKSIKIDDKRMERIASLSVNIDSLVSLRNDFQESIRTIQEIDKQLEAFQPLFREKAERRDDLSEMEHKIDDLKIRRKGYLREIEEIERKIPSKRLDIEFILNDLTGRDVRVEIT